MQVVVIFLLMTGYDKLFWKNMVNFFEEVAERSGNNRIKRMQKRVKSLKDSGFQMKLFEEFGL